MRAGGKAQKYLQLESAKGSVWLCSAGHRSRQRRWHVNDHLEKQGGESSQINATRQTDVLGQVRRSVPAAMKLGERVSKREGRPRRSTKGSMGCGAAGGWRKGIPQSHRWERNAPVSFQNTLSNVAVGWLASSRRAEGSGGERPLQGGRPLALCSFLCGEIQN
jgi:hypothetical protein